MKIQRLFTLLDTVKPGYRDTPWKPRGTKCFNGYRQHFVKGFRL
jgi:hypothetical protein